jgi:hypothetical protein
MLKTRFLKLIPLAITFFLLLLNTSCQRDEAEILGRNKMRKVLVDLHLLEGIFSVKHPPLTEREQVYYYEALFQKHKISRADFDSSLVYYTRNPKIYERLYTRVLSDLNALNQEVLDGKFRKFIPDSVLYKPYTYSMWYKADSLVVKHDSLRKELKFTLKDPALMIRDVYLWSFRIRISPADTTLAPYAVLRLHYADGKVDTLSHELKNDSVLRRYSFRLPAFRNQSIDSLSGSFMAAKEYGKKAAIRIDSIRISRGYVPMWQDSLRSRLDSLQLKKDTLTLKEVQTDDRIETLTPKPRPRKPNQAPKKMEQGEMIR